MAFDLPTQLGRDSDDPLCAGEVGRTGVPIDTIEDMRICFDQIPLDEVSTSMTINAPAAILLLLYELVGEEQGVPSEKLRGTVQNDVLKEYVARGNYIYPPEPTMRLTTDIFEYCAENVPKWNTISISGYHIREKGCSAVQEVAFTLSNAIAYVEAALERGLEIDEFAPRLAFFFNCHNNVFQEIAKFRAVRRMWARIVRERFGSESERSQMIRFHTQTGGVTLQAQQPEVNIIRVALQGFAAVCGGTQSLHTNGFDEALALPTERSARIALRTQQVIAHESGAAETVDPFAGSYFIESLTDEIEKRSWELIDKVARARRLGERPRVHPARDRGLRAQLPRALQERPGHRSSASTSTSPTRSTTSTSCASTRSPSGASWTGWPSSRLTATPRRWSAASRSCATSPGATATSWARSAPRSRNGRRSGRSVVRCGMCLASTGAGRFSRPGRPLQIGFGRQEWASGRRNPAPHGIERQADPGQIRPRALGARGRHDRMQSWMGGPRGRRRADRGRGALARARQDARLARGPAGSGRAARARARRERLRDHRANHRPSTTGPTRTRLRPRSMHLLDELGSPERRPFAAA